jgi:hypothetical protein
MFIQGYRFEHKSLIFACYQRLWDRDVNLNITMRESLTLKCFAIPVFGEIEIILSLKITIMCSKNFLKNFFYFK